MVQTSVIGFVVCFVSVCMCSSEKGEGKNCQSLRFAVPQRSRCDAKEKLD